MNLFCFSFRFGFVSVFHSFFQKLQGKEKENLNEKIQKKKIPNKILALRIQNTKTTAFGYLTTDGGGGTIGLESIPVHNMIPPSPITHTTLTHTHACSTLSTRVCVSEQIEC